MTDPKQADEDVLRSAEEGEEVLQYYTFNEEGRLVCRELRGDLSAHPMAQRFAADREEADLMYHFEMNEARRLGREEGREEGRRLAREEGQRRLLLRQAHVRFGELPSEVARRVEAATTEQVTRWGEQLMTAASLEVWCAAIEDEA